MKKRILLYALIVYCIFAFCFGFEYLCGLSVDEFSAWFDLSDPYQHGLAIISVEVGLFFSFCFFLILDLSDLIPWQKIFKRKSPPPADPE